MDKENERVTMDRASKKSLGEMLIEEKLITPEQLESALAQQRQKGGKLADILLKQGLVKRGATGRCP